MPLRFLAFTTLGLLGLAAPAHSQIIIGGPLAPTRTVYMPTTNVVTQSYVVGTPIGATAYVAPPSPMFVQQRPYVTTTTTYLPRRAYVPTTTYVPATTYVPRRTYIADPGLAPVGYEVVRPGRTRVVYPRRVVKYVY